MTQARAIADPAPGRSGHSPLDAPTTPRRPRLLASAHLLLHGRADDEAAATLAALTTTVLASGTQRLTVDLSLIDSSTPGFWRALAGLTATAHAERCELVVTGMQSSALLAGAITALAHQTSAARDQTAGAALAEPATIRRAIAFIDQNAGRPIKIADIAAAARIGPRGLQHAFRKHRSCTPLEYSRQVRMLRAHYDLQSADPTTGDTVSRIAAHWGFAHPGRFSEQYRRLFGCSPNKTLRG